MIAIKNIMHKFFIHLKIIDVTAMIEFYELDLIHLI